MNNESEGAVLSHGDNKISEPEIEGGIGEQNHDSDSDEEDLFNREVINMEQEPVTINVSRMSQQLKKGACIAVNKIGPQNVSNWSDMKLVSRAGKVSGRFKNCWNMKDCDSGEECYVDLDKVEWVYKEEEVPNQSNVAQLDSTRFSPETSEECLVSSEVAKFQKESVLKAKMEELDSWKKNNVYTEVEDVGQERISVRWVVSEKVVDNKIGIKARLCARGFEEIQDFRKDSPTCSKESMRLVMTIAASLKWSLNAIDIKTAFLQGNKFDRDVYVKPPREAATQKLWKLSKCVYGLGDASRQWYLTLKDKIVQAGGNVSTHDLGLFFCHKHDILTGLMPCHVDDLLWCGTNSFKQNLIKNLYENFVVGKASSVAFKYVGIDIKQEWDDKSIILSQDSYIQSMKFIEISTTRSTDKEAKLTEEEVTELRGAVGQLNWLSCVIKARHCI